MSAERDLTFQDAIDALENLGTDEWVAAYSSEEEPLWSDTWYSALVASDVVKRILGNFRWDLSIGSGLPGLEFSGSGGQRAWSYQRFADEGIEPLVFCRDFRNRPAKCIFRRGAASGRIRASGGIQCTTEPGPSVDGERCYVSKLRAA